MTSRERIQKAINFQEADRVPIDLGAMASTGIMATTYHELKKYLGMKGGRTRVADPGQMLAAIEKPVLERFGIDAVPMSGIASENPDDDSLWKPMNLPDGTPVEMPTGFKVEIDEEGGWVRRDKEGRVTERMPRNGFYFEGVPGPNPFLEAPAQEKLKVEDYKVPLLPDEKLAYLERRSKFLYEDSDRAILGNLYGPSLFNLGVGGFTEWMCTIAADKPYAHDLIAKAVEGTIANTRLYQQAVGDRTFAMCMSDDMGMQRGEFVHPDLFAELFGPHFKDLCQWVHQHTNYKIFLHSCGSIYNYIETLIDAGIDILNPVQTSAANMEPRRLKEKFGGRIVFWGGGCDTQRTLPFGTPEEVREHVKERIEIFAPGGGFVFTQVHNVQANTPPENIVAMLEAANEFGKYPIRSV